MLHYKSNKNSILIIEAISKSNTTDSTSCAIVSITADSNEASRPKLK